VRDPSRRLAVVLGFELVGAARVAHRPLAVPGMDAVADVAAGEGHTCVLRVDGRVQCWGLGESGQLGDGIRADRTVPSRVELDEPVREVALQARHTCALLDSGRVVCLGSGSRGQRPVNVPVMRTLARGGSEVFCGLGDDDDLICWEISRSGPAAAHPVASDVAIVSSGSGGLCWSSGRSGYCSGPSHVLGLMGVDEGNPPVEVPELGEARSIVLSRGHGCVVRESGALACWGDNRRGEVGDGSRERRRRPALVDLPAEAHDAAKPTMPAQITQITYRNCH